MLDALRYLYLRCTLGRHFDAQGRSCCRTCSVVLPPAYQNLGSCYTCSQRHDPVEECGSSRCRRRLVRSMMQPVGLCLYCRVLPRCRTCSEPMQPDDRCYGACLSCAQADGSPMDQPEWEVLFDLETDLAGWRFWRRSWITLGQPYHEP